MSLDLLLFQPFGFDGRNGAVYAFLLDKFAELVAVNRYQARSVHADVVDFIDRADLIKLVGYFVFRPFFGVQFRNTSNLLPLTVIFGNSLTCASAAPIKAECEYMAIIMSLKAWINSVF